MAERVIRASEVGRYAFCAHAWWLGSVQGLASAREPEMAAGTAAHRRHGRRVWVSALLRRIAYGLLALAAVAAALALLRTP